MVNAVSVPIPFSHMRREYAISFGMVAFALLLMATARAQSGSSIPSVEVKQITFGPAHHFFGYIGHARTIPWNQSGRYIVALETDFQDHMPAADEAARIILMDTKKNYSIRVIDRTRAWNPQQGTMLYWNPQAPETQFFFNDRDPAPRWNRDGTQILVSAIADDSNRTRQLYILFLRQ
jgi:hypothetical protein